MTHIHDNCEIKLLLKESFNTETCDKRVIKLHNGHYTQFERSNTWIYSMPRPEPFTINCENSGKPKDVVLSGTGSITIDKKCKGFSFTSMLIPHLILNGLNDSETVQLVPPFNLIDDCCLAMIF
jgi:hypothetical protein